mgnify:CR=1 FL=1
MTENKYKITINACFLAYIVQAIVNNFVPLLFVTFQREFDIPLSKITLLITFNFLIQLFVDLVSAKFVDKIGYKASMVIAHFMCAIGLVSLTFLPDLFNNSFVGILIAVMIYAVGGGLLEVIVSPVVEACPTDNKEKAMSLLHSFYCWGQMGVVLISTLFFTAFSIKIGGHFQLFGQFYLSLMCSFLLKRQLLLLTKTVNVEWQFVNLQKISCFGYFF